MGWCEDGVVGRSLALPERMLVSEWADRERRLDARTSAEPGRWRTDRTPYLREIMDCLVDSLVEQVTLMKSTQVGGTEAIFNMLGFAADQDPGPAMYVGPKEAVTREVSRTRVMPMFESSPALRRHLPSREDDFTVVKYALDRMNVHFAWAGSPAQLASFAIRYLLMDEVDKFPPFSGKEADPVKLARERTRTFVNRKIVLASTPTVEQGYINREYERSDKRTYRVPCPHCGHYQVLRMDQVRWPEELRDPDVIELDRLAWYECEACKGEIGDRHKQAMLAAGVWCPDGCEVGAGGVIDGPVPVTGHRGYHINALYSPWLTFSEVAGEFLRSKDDPATLMNFINSWLAQVWREKTDSLELSDVARLELGYERRVVPAGGLVLTAGVDVQKLVLYYVVRAWGYGEESWLVDEGTVGDFARLDEAVVNKRFATADGGSLPVFVAGIDVGYRTDEVYAYTRGRGDRVLAVKGASEPMPVPYSVHVVDTDASGRRLKHGHRYWRLNTHYYKDKVRHLADPERVGWHVYAGVSEDYRRQFVSEEKVIKRNSRGANVEYWQTRGAATPNHLWDCEVIDAAVADIRGVWALRPPGPGDGGERGGTRGGGLKTPDGQPFMVTERKG